ncbi:FAD-dependent oxidoreductase [Synechococcus sp. Cruz-9H2]|nr:MULTISPECIES: FAD-dependent oxidoreductase [unclassified Synechococcus]MCP9871911.1 FAD-dependent oxidoreductase [Synechococcus sp. Cruz-7B9]MCP9820990.1 FAD-dependent oxidoreductase [Synechococcus sp. Cruz-9H2]MCP9845222.1 FAD-dependent oxidoreductase [Synechococcus sp. Edmonson 11F2]MCP9857393.1 FAD-dependent oxidoreductase [Synechococcus sp. Cruz-9C9]MCP9864638.1 FAD-dependent oxidoreductase [Synechococcus sp. Cruz-7E5]
MTFISPRILLVGAGRFGRHHLDEWIRLGAEGLVQFHGVVVRDEIVAKALRSDHGVSTFSALTDQLLSTVDAVDIVTPPTTHFDLVRQCLPFAHVLVEKPMSIDEVEAVALSDLARESNRILMVGHVFRFHSVVEELKRLVTTIPVLPRGISGTMVNPADEKTGRSDACLEFLHLFDVLDHLFDLEPEIIVGRPRGCLVNVSLRYPGPMSAVVRLGWVGAQKKRTLELLYADRRIEANLLDNTLVVSTRNNQLHKTFFLGPTTALGRELKTFLSVLRDPTLPYPDPSVGRRLVRIAQASRPAIPTARPRIAVIGGGIFGISAALELAGLGDVTLFERHENLLTETSASNQRRHHSGFHYPRSYDSIVEIQSSRTAFEAMFGSAIDRSFPSFYCTSATGVEIPAERYLAACEGNHLAFTVTVPPEGIVAPQSVSLCLRTDEGIYDVSRLRRVAGARLTAHPHVQCELRTAVISGVIAADGTKRLTVDGPTSTRQDSFDYVINATYGGRNLMARWFGFPVEPLRFDLYELLLLPLPIPQIAVTVMDGPFTSLTGTGRDGEFLLSHIHDSVSRSVIPDDGMPPTWTGITSNRDNMLRHSSHYFPVLDAVTEVRSIWMTRAVNAYARDFDARPTVISDHGFGCWSVLGGKVVTAVSNAREIASTIATELGWPQYQLTS